ncbi:MAG: DUF6161 domain-containing protein [Verrucomicrobiae bacterium]|nr:DUF6161 domain-containing protein [Verrucomicrobiae bacterium]
MDNLTSPKEFEFNLGTYGGVIKISSPGELKDWAEKEWNLWAWGFLPPTDGMPPIQIIVNSHKTFKTKLHELANQWAGGQNIPQRVETTLISLGQLFTEYYCNHNIIHSSSVEAAFLFGLREKRGDKVAMGAYASLLNISLSSVNNTNILDGLFEGFLYKREVDWTGTANSEVFNQLRKQYESNLTQQAKVSKEIETRNANLNQAYEITLKERSDALLKLEGDKKNTLDKLHADQSSAFTDVIKKHENNLKAIELTYDQKLALQKPVEYWQTKERYHGRLSLRFGIAALLTMLVLGSALGFLIYNVLSHLGTNENPKNWQIGILLIALFFSIWSMRIIVRLFLSHLHLAGDASERQTMILTYLSMSREGSNFTPDDKKLILQHLFRSTSDGLVKDDAAPPTPLEMLTRK